MFRSRLTRFLVLGAAVASVAGLSATTASAATNYVRYDPGQGKCFLPNPSQLRVFYPTITAPAANYTNDWGVTVKVRKWTVIINAATLETVSWHFVAERNVGPYGSTSFGEDTLYIPARSSNWYPVRIQNVLATYWNNPDPFEVDTGTATSYLVSHNGESFTYTDPLPASSC